MLGKFWTDYSYEKYDLNRIARKLTNKMTTDYLPVVSLTEAELPKLEMLIIDERENGALIPMFRTSMQVLDKPNHEKILFNAKREIVPSVQSSL